MLKGKYSMSKAAGCISFDQLGRQIHASWKNTRNAMVWTFVRLTISTGWLGINSRVNITHNFKLFTFRALHDEEAENELKTVREAWDKFHADAVVVREAATLEFSDTWSLLDILK